jgi:hypothetical protein
LLDWDARSVDGAAGRGGVGLQRNAVVESLGDRASRRGVEEDGQILSDLESVGREQTLPRRDLAE